MASFVCWNVGLDVLGGDGFRGSNSKGSASKLLEMRPSIVASASATSFSLTSSALPECGPLVYPRLSSLEALLFSIGAGVVKPVEGVKVVINSVSSPLQETLHASIEGCMVTT